MKFTEEMLRQIMPNCPKKVREAQLPVINDVLKEFDISKYLRVAAFLATLAVESGEFRYNEEIASGAAYEGRKDLGNIFPGDGKKFKGRGRIQVTGRENYTKCGEYFKKDLINHPELLAEEPLATRSAGWFFSEFKKLNSLADSRQFLAIQIKVNGKNKRTGLPNHWDERKAYYDRALRVLPEDFSIDKKKSKLIDDATLPDYMKILTIPEEDTINKNPETPVNQQGDLVVEKNETPHPSGWTTWKTTLAGIWGALGLSGASIAAKISGLVQDPFLAKVLVIFGVVIILIGCLFGLTYLIIRTIHINRKDKYAHELQLKEMEIKSNPDLNNVTATLDIQEEVK